MPYVVASSFDRIRFRTVLVSGACRSGKSTVCNLLASIDGIEHADEPWLPLTLPSLVRTGLLPAKAAAEVLRAGVAEIYNDSVLLRNANFRASDQSSVWKQREGDEILFRLHQLNRREDVVRFARERKGTLLLNLPETLPGAAFFRRSVPGLKILHPFRHPERVAHEIFRKEWFGDEQLLAPRNAQVYFQLTRRRKRWFVPWWVRPRDRARFVEMRPAERSFFYWVTLLEQGLAATRGSDVRHVHFDDLLANPWSGIRSIARWLGKSPGKPTRERVARLAERREPLAKAPPEFISGIDPALRRRGELVFERLMQAAKSGRSQRGT